MSNERFKTHTRTPRTSDVLFGNRKIIGDGFYVYLDASSRDRHNLREDGIPSVPHDSAYTQLKQLLFWSFEDALSSSMTDTEVATARPCSDPISTHSINSAGLCSDPLHYWREKSRESETEEGGGEGGEDRTSQHTHTYYVTMICTHTGAQCCPPL